MFPLLSQDVIGTAATLAYSLYLFLIAVKMDVGMIKKTGHKAIAIGISSAAVPLVCGVFAAVVCSRFLHIPGKNVFVLVGTHSVTSFAVVSSLLQDLKLLNSELGRLGLSSALIRDVINVILTSTNNFVRDFNGKGVATFKIFMDIAVNIGFVLAIVFIIRPALYWIVRRTPAGKPVKDVYVYAIFVLFLLSARLSHMLGQGFLGPFILGLAVPVGPPLGSALVKKLECIVSGVFLPVFVSVCAIKVDLSGIAYDGKLLMLDTILMVLTFGSNVLSSFVPSLICKMPFRDALALGFIMSSKGIVDLDYYALFRDFKVIN